MSLSDKEKRVLYSTRLRNLQRRYDRTTKDDERIEIKDMIDSTKELIK